MPFAHFSTKQTSPASLFFAFWKSVHCLMIAGFDVIYCCLDGSTVNRAFVQLHFKDKDPVREKFATINPYKINNFIFIIDPDVIKYA